MRSPNQRELHEERYKKWNALSEAEKWLKRVDGAKFIYPVRAAGIKTREQLEAALGTDELDGYIFPEGRQTLTRLIDAATSDTKNDKTARCVQDAIHGPIEFPRWIWKELIDTKPFQRMRHLKQMGPSSYVFPSATHTRFEHSLGVGHLSGLWFKKLASKLIPYGEHRDWVQTLHDSVVIAGLSHDLGHGPFSHSFELFMNHGKAPEDNTRFRHEDMSEKIFKHLLDDSETHLGETVDRLGTKELILNIIRGQKPKKKRNSDDPTECLEMACHDIVANSDTGVDVDRFDYLKRDSVASLGNNYFDHTRLLNFSCIVGESIAFNFKNTEEIFQFYSQRYQMYAKIYTHKRAQGIEYMLSDMMAALDPILKLSECVNDNDVVRYLELNDTITSLPALLARGVASDSSHIPCIAKALEIQKNLESRCIYKYIGDIIPDQNDDDDDDKKKMETCKALDEKSKHWTCENLTENIFNESRKASPQSRLKKEDVIVHRACLSYGSPGDKSPWDKVKFYNDDSLEPEDTVIYPKDLRDSFPSRWSNVVWRVFCRTHNPGRWVALDQGMRAWAGKREVTPVYKPSVLPIDAFRIHPSHRSDSPTSSS